MTELEADGVVIHQMMAHQHVIRYSVHDFEQAAPDHLEFAEIFPGVRDSQDEIPESVLAI